ncbi:hypothetical protein [Segatella copri]|uniref:hypothetical protein n=2 Tax=Segatella copri TaxID=165179 RepID=UPI001F3DC897|nr:hypothetical protein [Segatella copri]
MLKFYPKSLAVTINSRKFAAVLKFSFMQTVNLQYNVPAGYSLEEFVAKVNSYVARLTKKCQAGEEYEANEETKAAIREAQAHIEAYKRGEEWAKKDVFDNVDDLMADLMKD